MAINHKIADMKYFVSYDRKAHSPYIIKRRSNGFLIPIVFYKCKSDVINHLNTVFGGKGK